MEAQMEKEKPDLPARELLEKAVEDAQLLAAHATRIREKVIDGETLTTLITARRLIEDNQPISIEFEVEFWLAYQYIVGLVRPVTADSIKANQANRQPIDPFFRKLFKAIPVLSQWSKPRNTNPRQTAGRYVAFTVLVLVGLLILQIYWVIGNQLTAQLADLLQRETELSRKISENRQEYSAIEIRFKQNEADSESFKTSGIYTFYPSPEWERDTLENISTRNQLEADLASLKSQIERGSDILLRWSSLWDWLIRKKDQSALTNQKDQYDFQIASIQGQIEEIDAQLEADPKSPEQIQEVRNNIADLQSELAGLELSQEANSEKILKLKSEIDALTNIDAQLETDPANSEQIQEVRNNITNSQEELAALELSQKANSDSISKKRSEIDDLTNWVNLVNQLKKDRRRLDQEKASILSQQQSANKREAARQAQLAGQFVLVILQSYLLPLLYGILGAGTYALRFLSQEVETVTYSEEAGIQHLLRIALGALAGIMVGWFSFLIPNETTTFVGTISPLAIAFLVGYNIELFFSLMDRAINWIRKPSSEEQQKAEEEQRTAEAEKKKYAVERKKQATEDQKHTGKSQKKGPHPPSGQPLPA